MNERGRRGRLRRRRHLAHERRVGDVYSMVMTDADGAAAEVHDRMPVLLAAGDYEVWTDGAADEAWGL